MRSSLSGGDHQRRSIGECADKRQRRKRQDHWKKSIEEHKNRRNALSCRGADSEGHSGSSR